MLTEPEIQQGRCDMLQDAIRPTDGSQEIKYVPDVHCPNCAELILLARDTYRWYVGPLRCGRCMCQMQVEIGDYRKDYIGNMSPTTLPSGTLQGGFLLSAPRIIEQPNTIPWALVDGTESEKVPDVVRLNFRTAIKGFDEGRYDDAVVRCRVTLEAALRLHGIKGDSPARLIEAAHQDRLLIEPYEKYGQIVTTMGGRSAHDRPPISQGNALLVIGLTAALVRMLYEV